MSNFLKKFNIFDIKPSFYILVIASIFFQITELLLHTLFFVALHELSHIIIAIKLGFKIEKITICPAGMIAKIKDLESAYLHQRIVITSAGVLFNLIVVALFFENSYIKAINLSIAIFNMLPILPLDGGKLYSYILGNKIGDINALKVMIKISKSFSFILLILGFIQIIIMPYNISLFILALYFFKNNNTIYITSFCNTINKKFDTNKIFKVRQIFVNEDFQNKKILQYFSADYLTIIKCINKNYDKEENPKILYTITEIEVLLFVQNNGLNGAIKNLKT